MTRTRAVRWGAIFSAMISCANGGSTANATPIGYQLPEETSTFDPGKNLEAVQDNCTACHSPDYIKTQPRGPAFGKDFWRSEVMKMIKNYGAPIEDSDVEKIVDYLATNY